MPPKGASTTARPQHARKPSAIANPDPFTKEKGKGKEKGMDAEKGKKDDSAIMPPPPPPCKPPAILEPEMNALEDSLKNVTVTAAQIFRFYADTKKLGVQNRAPRPPRSMTSDLEHELGRYDQICDAIDTHLARSIAILQRDLAREENRIREEEAERARAKAAEASARDRDIEMDTGTGSSNEVSGKQQQVPPSGALAGTGKVPLRRPSKISLSTLHRSPFPLKLDLSSTSLRLGSEEVGLNMSALDNLDALTTLGSMSVDGISGLASPVTLAPKSARPMGPGELPPEVLAALASASGVGNQNMQLPDPSHHVDIDLTLDDDLRVSVDLLNSGDSADKPIELDIESDVMMADLHVSSDIFGEQGGNGKQPSGSPVDSDIEKLFGPETAGMATASNADDGNGVDMSMLLSENHGDEFFASLDPKNNSPHDDSISRRTETGAGQGDGSGDNAGFDYSLFFNESTNQEQIDMMTHFLKMENTGTVAGASGSEKNSALDPSVAT
ncbi:hypothetical protein ACEPAF_3251 [Sanghuangporus sanghuang]